MQATVSGTLVRLVCADITTCRVDAIVNAANSGLLGGGGVDGAIHRAGGASILAECREIVARNGPLPPGQAVITSAGNLPARWVIHTVGPVWHGGDQGEDECLRVAYENSLRVAVEHEVRSIAFPAISTGVYRFPRERAAQVAYASVRDFLTKNQFSEVVFVSFHQADMDVYRRAFVDVFIPLVAGNNT